MEFENRTALTTADVAKSLCDVFEESQLKHVEDEKIIGFNSGIATRKAG